jgi:hypothetical protein
MNTSNKLKGWMTWFSLLLLFVPLSILILWINVFESNPGASQADKVKLFRTYLPNVIANNTSIVVLLSSVIALVFASISTTNKFTDYKAINIIVIIISLLISSLTLFSLL